MSFWDGLDEGTRSSLQEVGRDVRYAPGEWIVREGEPASDLFVLRSGSCDVLLGGEPIARIEPGELFGEIGSLGGGIRTASVQAAVPCSVLLLEQARVRGLFDSSPRALAAFMRVLAERTRQISAREANIRKEQRDLQSVQEALLPGPKAFARSRRFSLDRRWRPLSLASGDCADVVELAGGRYLVVIADVAGHGARTAPTAAALRMIVRDLATRGLALPDILGAADRRLESDAPPDIHVTMSLLLVDDGLGSARVAGAGHPAPVLGRGGVSSAVDVPPGLPLGFGFGRQHPYTEAELPLLAGDRILLYTDGLSESVVAGSERLGEEGVQRAFGDALSASPEDPLGRLFDTVGGGPKGFRFRDDATALLLSVR